MENQVSKPRCSCESFERLEGASVNAYINAFLEQVGSATTAEKNRYRCRVCGREWEKRTPDVKSAGTRPSLIRISS